MKTSRITYARSFAAAVVASAAILFFSCSSPDSDAPATAPPVPVAKKAPQPDKKAAPKISVAPESGAVEEYSYDPTGKIDPFLPLIAEAPERQPSAVQTRRVLKPLTPLQKFDLKDLKLVAVISTPHRASALVQDPSGFGYIVKEGMLIGKNDGMLKKIIGNGIIIEEQMLNSLGEPETRISTLTIQHK